MKKKTKKKTGRSSNGTVGIAQSVKLDKTGNLPSSPGYQNLVHDSAIQDAAHF
jgi:hypothetical protein